MKALKFPQRSRVLVALFVAPSLGALAPTAAAAQELPNIVIIYADDLGYGDLSAYNEKAAYKTPRLDRMAAEGIRFVDAHSPSTICSPSRYGLMSGEQVCRTGRGSRAFEGPGGPSYLAPGKMSIADMLRGQGYRTGIFGKWHLGLTWYDEDGKRLGGGFDNSLLIDYQKSTPLEDGPNARGFDESFVTPNCPTTDPLYVYLENGMVPVPASERHQRDRLPNPGGKWRWDNDEGWMAPGFEFVDADLLFYDKTVEFIRAHRETSADTPFFAVLSTQISHAPVLPAKEFLGKSGAGPRGDFVHELDVLAGRLLDELEALGIDDNTLVIFNSDNGPETLHTDWMRRDHDHDAAGGFRGMKRDGWEGGHRVPFIARWPGRIPAGQVSSQLTNTTDIFATLASVVGFKLPADVAVDSFDMLPAMLGTVKDTEPIRPHMLTQSFRGEFQLRQGDWKYLAHMGSGGNGYGKGPLKAYALPETAPEATGQLFHLAQDPGERTNLFFTEEARRKELQGLLGLLTAKGGRSAPLERVPVGPLPAPSTAGETAPATEADHRVAGWEQHLEQTAKAPGGLPPWRALGPKNCGGRIEAVDSPAGKPSVIYAGVGSGGVWKSVNGGLSWDHVFANESTFSVGDVTVDPQDGETVWVGTGEAHLGGMSYDGTGVFKSTDGGRSWKNMGLRDSARIGKVLVDPRDSDVVHVAVIGPRRGADPVRGVHVSRDGGETWEQTLFAGEEVGIIDLVRDPSNADRLWAAAWDRRRQGNGGVFRSSDGGKTWERLGGGLLSGKVVGRVALAAAASEPGVVYALMVDHSPPGEGRYDVGGALYRSDDGGDTWARTSKDYVDTYIGWDFCDVMVSPDDADEVFVCGFRLMVSRDGGASFERGGDKVFRLQDHPGKGMHLDMHDLWIDPGNPDRILLGTDGGLYESRDCARSWLHLNNLPIAEFYTVYLDQATPFGIWGGTQDNASLVGSSNAKLVDETSDDWAYVYLDPWDGGDGFATFPDPSGDGTQYYEHQNGDMRRKRPGAPLRWGKDSGRRITPRAAKGDPKLRFAWNTPLFPSVHAAQGEVVLYCGTQFAMRSTDRGDSWNRISDDLTGGRGAITTLVESPLDPMRLAAGAGQSVSLTSDGGATWKRAGKGLPSVSVQRLALSGAESDRVFVCLSGVGGGDHRPHVFRSEDFGASWIPMGAGLPHAPVNVVMEDPRGTGWVFAGMDLGVYGTKDGGDTWVSLSRGLPTAPVMDLGLDVGSSTLVAVTHGLSAFALDLSEFR